MFSPFSVSTNLLDTYSRCSSKIVVASAWLPYVPMLPLQLLFQNLLYDFSQATIPWSVNHLLVPYYRLTWGLDYTGIMSTLSTLLHQRFGMPAPLLASWFAWARHRACLTFVSSLQTGTIYIFPYLTRGPWISNRYKYKIRTVNSPLVPLAQTNWFSEGALTQVKIFLRSSKVFLTVHPI